jgi:hypothetical protein
LFEHITGRWGFSSANKSPNQACGAEGFKKISIQQQWLTADEAMPLLSWAIGITAEVKITKYAY